MAKPFSVSDATFSRQVLEASAPVVVDFGADWCRPCKMLDPIVADLAREWEGRVAVATVDVDANPDTALRFGVFSIPTLILFVGGEPKARLSGYVPKRRIVETFAPHLPAVSAAA